MKKSLFVYLFILMPIFVWAQVSGELYDKKVVEISNLRRENETLKGKIDSLQGETATLKREVVRLKNTEIQRDDAIKQRDHLKKELSQCEKEKSELEKKLDSQKFESIKQCSDSIEVINIRVSALSSEIESYSKQVHNLEDSITRKNNELQSLRKTEQFFTQYFVGKTVDELAKYSEKELLLYKYWFEATDREIPKELKQILFCRLVERQLKEKYNDKAMADLQQKLPMNSEIGKNLAQKIQRYKSVNSAAKDLWNKIDQNACWTNLKEIDNPQTQIDAKRKVWQSVQRFLNQNPDLLDEFPYVYMELQKMLREVWTDANNFKNSKNHPFE